jgi:hypothetical protein
MTAGIGMGAGAGTGNGGGKRTITRSVIKAGVRT